MYGVQRSQQGPIAIAEIPLELRDPVNAQRFRRTLRGSEPLWQLTWTDKTFHES